MKYLFSFQKARDDIGGRRKRKFLGRDVSMRALKIENSKLIISGVTIGKVLIRCWQGVHFWKS